MVKPSARSARASKRSIRKLPREEIHRREFKYASRYTDEDFELIAAAIGDPISRVRHQAPCFEEAARWYHLARRNPRSRNSVRPSVIQRRLTQIADTAERLLLYLGVPDGSGAEHQAIFDALVFATEDADEDKITRSTVALERFREILASVCAAAEVHGRARQAARDVSDLSKLVVPIGYQGDQALNLWVAWILPVHRHLTGADVRLPLRRGESARLWAFLSAAGRPLGIVQSQSQWRDRVKTIVRSQPIATTAPI